VLVTDQNYWLHAKRVNVCEWLCELGATALLVRFGWILRIITDHLLSRKE